MRSAGVVLFFGYLAAALVFATFLMRSRTRLRQVGIVSNVAFITYGIVGNVIPLLVLHSLLLPLNIWRLWELNQTHKGILAAISGDLRADWLEPFASTVNLHSGQKLFAQGDLGDAIYFIVSGTVRLIESGIELGPGSLIGEVAIFSPAGTRTQSVVASSDTRLVSMSQDELITLYSRHPAFGVYLLRLVTRRLLENTQRAQTGHPTTDV